MRPHEPRRGDPGHRGGPAPHAAQRTAPPGPGAYLVFNTAEWATYVALLVWAFDQGGAGAAAAIALIQLVPAALVAPWGR